VAWTLRAGNFGAKVHGDDHRSPPFHGASNVAPDGVAIPRHHIPFIATQNGGSTKVRNVPGGGYYAWDPGGYIGLYQPDTFWIAQ